jgi:HNH endonuclease
VLTERQLRTFEAKVDRSAGPDACHPWTACRTKDGYGRFGSGGRLRANRVALELHLGRSLEHEKQALHTCDNPPCCNPLHLWEGTNAENVADSIAKGRKPTRRERTPRGRARGARHGLVLHPERAARGERNGRATIDSEIVRQIRSMPGSTAAVARFLKLPYLAVWKVRTGKTWKHVA